MYGYQGGRHRFGLVWLLFLSALLGGLVAVVAVSCFRPDTARAAAPVTRLGTVTDGFAGIVDAVRPAVVNIYTEQEIQRRALFPDWYFDPWFGSRRVRPYTWTQRQTNLGSGVVVSPDGYILTNQHVVANATRIQVKLDSNRTLAGQVIPVPDEMLARDLALVKVSARGLSAAKLGDAGQARIGSWVIAVGSPFGFSESVTAGVLSAKGRVLQDEEGQFKDLLQTDAAINPGNSGGPLLDAEGRVIGINQAIYSPTGSSVGIGFAVPLTAETKSLINHAIDRARGGA